MANICNYEVKVKGSKNACLMVFHSMPAYEKWIDSEEQDGDLYVMNFSGNCKWSIDYGVKHDTLKRINVDTMSEEEIMEKGGDYWEYSLNAKAKAFQCEISIHHWSEESGFNLHDEFGLAYARKSNGESNGFDIEDGVLKYYNVMDGVTEVIIPNGVIEIETNAFSECEDIVSIVIPDGVTKIGWHSFEGCKGLTSITFPDSLIEIGHDAFNGYLPNVLMNVKV